MKFLLRCCIIAAVITVSLQSTQACVGARPLGMGGAFIGLADDADATYWNPAGLAFQDRKQVKGMLVLESDVNYKSNLSFVLPIENSKTKNDDSNTAVGINIIGYNTLLKSSNGKTLTQEPLMIKVCFASKISKDLSIGGTITRHSSTFTLSDNTGVLDSADVSSFGLDIGILNKIDDKLSIGLLIQDVNKPTDKSNGVEFQTHLRNVRPGMAYRPNDSFILTADIYNLLASGGYKPGLCLGCEYKPDNKMYTIRGGIYQLSSDNSMITLGGSVHINENASADASLLDGRLIIGGSYSF